MDCFNPRARDGRDCTLTTRLFSPSSFNPRARDGRDVLLLITAYVTYVSIHAPVMDAMVSTTTTEQYIMFQSTRP